VLDSDGNRVEITVWGVNTSVIKKKDF
jgi:hypothetical protein